MVICFETVQGVGDCATDGFGSKFLFEFKETSVDGFATFLFREDVCATTVKGGWRRLIGDIWGAKGTGDVSCSGVVVGIRICHWRRCGSLTLVGVVVEIVLLGVSWGRESIRIFMLGSSVIRLRTS